jgi:hypothetical protein
MVGIGREEVIVSKVVPGGTVDPIVTSISLPEL